MKWSTDNDNGTDVPISVHPADIAAVERLVNARGHNAHDRDELLAMILGGAA